jgi:hypothetical protein
MQQSEVILNHDKKMFAMLDKAKLNMQNTGGLSLAAVGHTTLQVT